MSSYSRFASLQRDPSLKVGDWSIRSGLRVGVTLLTLMLLTLFSCAAIEPSFRTDTTQRPSESRSLTPEDTTAVRLPPVRGI